MSNLNRTLTLRVQIVDESKANWIWDLHRTTQRAENSVGVLVHVIANGDVFAELDMLAEQVAMLLDKFTHYSSASHLEDDVEDGITPDTTMVRDLIAKMKAAC